MRRQVFGLGALELLLSALVLGFALAMLGEGAGGAVGLGLALAMSSTALVLPIAGAHAGGRAALAMLLFEDLALVPIIFLLGALAPQAAGGGLAELAHTLWIGLLVVLALLVGRFLLPPLFAQAARTKSPELFLSASLLVVIVAALATAGAGLRLSWGADRGAADRGNRISHRGRRHYRALQGAGAGVFLITIGMSIDLAMVRHWLSILAATAGVVVVKAVVTAVLLRLLARARPCHRSGHFDGQPFGINADRARRQRRQPDPAAPPLGDRNSTGADGNPAAGLGSCSHRVWKCRPVTPSRSAAVTWSTGKPRREPVAQGSYFSTSPSRWSGLILRPMSARCADREWRETVAAGSAN
jgi:hypothetical protein